MSVEEWEAMAAWYDAKQGDAGDLWHRTLIDPTLLRLVGEVEGLRVLDLACGNGYIARKLARQGATVTGVDASEPIVRLAQEREERDPLGIVYHVSEAANLAAVDDATFDLVVSNMALMDIEDGEGAIGEVGRVLKTRGRFVASLSHPCFDLGNRSAWEIERVVEPETVRTTVWRKVTGYREPFHGRVPWGPADRRYQTVYYHRPLSWYFRALRRAGFVVGRVEEPVPTQEFLESESPQGPWIAEIPLHMVLEAYKASVP